MQCLWEEEGWISASMGKRSKSWKRQKAWMGAVGMGTVDQV